MWIIYIFVNIGMWFERFVITVTSLHRDFLTGSWGYYKPSIVDILTFAGSFGLFFTLVLLFVRYLPMVAMAEVKTVMPIADAHSGERRSVGDYHGDIPRHVREVPDGGGK
jgi:molybdopterin-containing oxidoreductase family membrane subunit